MRKKMAAAPFTGATASPLPDFRRGEGQATSVLKRSALAVARFDSGWNASPASLTSDSVSFELSATARSNEARANSLCSCRYSVGDFASASERIASAACSTPSRCLATTSWPIERAPSVATRPASTIASTLARARSASSSLTFWLFLASSWPRSPALANSDWNGANAGMASNAGEEIVGLGHGLNPFLGRGDSLPRGVYGSCGARPWRAARGLRGVFTAARASRGERSRARRASRSSRFP